MSDRWNSGSRWSSAREREERERAREAEREAQRQARLNRAAGKTPDGNAKAPPSTSAPSGQRRLSDDERRTIRAYRFPAPARDASESTSANEEASSRLLSSKSAPSTANADDTPRGTPIGRKWRSSLESSAAESATPASLPDLPGAGGRRGNGRLVIFGAALFGLMAIVAFLPFGPFAADREGDVTPTPLGTLPSILDDSTPSSDQNVRATEAVASGPPPDSEQVVCLDAGHGGWDPGWERNDLIDPPYAPPFVNEAELNLGMALMLRDALEAEDITVVMTRISGGGVNVFEEDINQDGNTRRSIEDDDRAEQAADRDELQARINICNEANADILVSLHLNGADDRETARGYEVLYTAAPVRPFGDESQELATLVYRQIDAAMRESEYGGTWGRGIKPDSSLDAEQHDLGSEEHLVLTGPGADTPEYTIRPSEMPGVVIEGVFLSNDPDAQFIVQPDNQQMLVDAYARGILEYFANNTG